VQRRFNGSQAVEHRQGAGDDLGGQPAVLRPLDQRPDLRVVDVRVVGNWVVVRMLMVGMVVVMMMMMMMMMIVGVVGFGGRCGWLDYL
jgi:hypothetical protein